MDACISLRKTYNAILASLTVNNYVTLIISSLPQLYILSYMIYNVTTTVSAAFIYSSYMNGTGFSIFAVLLLSWILEIISLCKTMPNLLTVSIFVYRCFAHWALVSSIIILIYLSSYLGARTTGYLSAGLIPPILLLLFTVDILRASRTRMYKELEDKSRVSEEGIVHLGDLKIVA
jgi:hypothetical protein